MGTRWNGFGRSIPTDFQENVGRVFDTPADIPYDWKYGEVVVDQPGLAAYCLVQFAVGSATGTTVSRYRVLESSPTILYNRGTDQTTPQGGRVLRIHNDGTARAADAFAGGIVYIAQGTAAGEEYRIAGHPAAAANAYIPLTLSRPLRQDVPSSGTNMVLFANPYRSMVLGTVASAANARPPSGVTVGETSYSSVYRPSMFVKVDGLAIVQATGSTDIDQADNDGTPVVKHGTGTVALQGVDDPRAEVGVPYGYAGTIDVSAFNVWPIKLTFGPRFINI